MQKRHETGKRPAPAHQNALTIAIAPASCGSVLPPLLCRSVRCKARGLVGAFWWGGASRLATLCAWTLAERPSRQRRLPLVRFAPPYALLTVPTAASSSPAPVRPNATEMISVLPLVVPAISATRPMGCSTSIPSGLSCLRLFPFRSRPAWWSTRFPRRRRCGPVRARH